MDKSRASGMRTALSVSGMTCGGCAGSVKRALSAVPGVTAVDVDLGGGRAVVTGGVHPDDLVRAVEAAGYGARVVPDTAVEGEAHGHHRGHCC